MQQELGYAWAAGFVEADGCIHLDRSERGRVQVIVVQKELAPIRRLQRIFNDTSKIGIVSRPNGTAVYYRLVFRSHRATEMLRKMLPYLEHKRQMADLALELLERVAVHELTRPKGRGVCLDPAEAAARQAICTRARLLGHAERLSESAPALKAG